MTAALRLRMLPRFPARIVGTDGVKVTRATGSPDLTVSLDFATLGDIAGIPDPAQNYFAMYDAENETYVRIPFQSMFDAAGVANGYPTITAAELANIPVPVHAIEVYGDNAVGDGAGGLFIDTNNGASITFISGDGRTWYLAEDISEDRLLASFRTKIFNSANHNFLNSGTGPTTRSVQDRLRDTLSVLDCGTVDLTGGVTAQTVVDAAVLNAYDNGRTLYWPPGTYLTTATIPRFHDVRHFGPGVVKRGTDLFYIEPKDADTNHIYVSSTGVNTNDGLDASSPILTLSKVNVILVNTMPAQRGGTWEINFAAGTYSDSTNFPDLPFYRNAIRFIGTGTSRTPQTIFDGTAAAYQTAGMYFQNRTKIYLQYIKFQDFTSGYGLLAEHNCQVELVDCDAENCTTGFAAGYSSFIRTTRCLAYLCSTGFRASSNAQGSFAPGSGSIADSNRAYSCGLGFVITRISYGHIDYNEIEDCTGAGIHIEINSRSAAEGNNFKRNAVAIRGWTSGYVSLNSGALNTYNQASGVDRNTEVYEFRGSSGIVNTHGQIGTMDVSMFKSTTAVTVTGTATATQIGGTLYTADAGWFIDNTKSVKFIAWGTTTTPADGTVLLSFRAASTSVSGLSIPVSVTAQTWNLEVDCIPTASNAQKTRTVLTVGGKVSETEIQVDALDFLSADRAFTFFIDPNGAGATTTNTVVEFMELKVSG